MEKNSLKEKANFRVICSYGTNYIKNIQLSPRAAPTEPGCTGTHRPQLETPCASAKEPTRRNKDLRAATKARQAK